MAVPRGRPPLVPKKSSSMFVSAGMKTKRRPSSLTPSRRRSSSTVYDDEFFRSLAELDETVASISGDSSSVQGSVSTDFGHNVLTSRHAWIGNMEQVKKDHSMMHHRRSRSVTSRRRGPSLERTIDSTIRSSYDIDEDHIHVNLARSPSTEDILKDLQQADAVLSSETGTLMPPMAFDDEPDLLPPAMDDWEWKPQWEDSVQANDPLCSDDPFGAWPAFESLENRPDPVGDHWDESVERFNSSFTFSAANFDPTVVTDFSHADNPFADKRSSPSCVAEGPWF